MRLFIACEIPVHIINQAVEIQQQLQQQHIFKGTYTKKDGLHITLKFLGDVHEDQLDHLKQIVRSIEFNQVQAQMGNVDFFSSGEHIRILFWHVISPGLKELMVKLNEQLPEYPAERRDIVPHLTLARIKSVDDQSLFMQNVASFKVPHETFKITEVVLKKSELTPTGSHYANVARFKLS